jgi:hypothetical protein
MSSTRKVDSKPSQRLVRISARTGKPIGDNQAETKNVFQAAGRAAEFFDHLRTHYRETRRTPAEIKARIKLLLANGSVFDSGTATVKNISPSGALLSNVTLPKGCYPIGPFRMEVLMDGGDYDGIGLEAVPVRFEHQLHGLGVKFSEIFVTT